MVLIHCRRLPCAEIGGRDTTTMKRRYSSHVVATTMIPMVMGTSAWASLMIVFAVATMEMPQVVRSKPSSTMLRPGVPVASTKTKSTLQPPPEVWSFPGGTATTTATTTQERIHGVDNSNVRPPGMTMSQSRTLNTVLTSEEQATLALTNHNYYDLVWERYHTNATRKGSVEVVDGFSPSEMETAYSTLIVTDTGDSSSSHGIPAPRELAICHLLALWRYSTLVPDLASDDNGLKAQSLGTGFYGDSAGVLMAAHHFNHGVGTVVKELEGINQRCNVRFTTEFVDSYSSLTRSVETISEAHRRGVTTADYNTTTSRTEASSSLMDPASIRLPRPCAILGPFRSAVSAATGVMTGVYGLPQISPGACRKNAETCRLLCAV
jgi:hypothetical protein